MVTEVNPSDVPSTEGSVTMSNRFGSYLSHINDWPDSSNDYLKIGSTSSGYSGFTAEFTAPEGVDWSQSQEVRMYAKYGDSGSATLNWQTKYFGGSVWYTDKAGSLSINNYLSFYDSFSFTGSSAYSPTWRLRLFRNSNKLYTIDVYSLVWIAAVLVTQYLDATAVLASAGVGSAAERIRASLAALAASGALGAVDTDVRIPVAFTAGSAAPGSTGLTVRELISALQADPSLVPAYLQLAVLAAAAVAASQQGSADVEPAGGVTAGAEAVQAAAALYDLLVQVLTKVGAVPAKPGLDARLAVRYVQTAVGVSAAAGAAEVDPGQLVLELAAVLASADVSAMAQLVEALILWAQTQLASTDLSGTQVDRAGSFYAEVLRLSSQLTQLLQLEGGVDARH